MRFILSVALGVVLGGLILYWLFRIGIRGVLATISSLVVAALSAFLIWYFFLY